MEVGNLGALTQSTQYSVSTATNTTLQVEEALGDKTSPQVVEQEVCYVLTNLGSDRIWILECASLIGNIALDNTNDTVCIHLDVRLANTIACLADIDGLAEGMILNLVNIMNTLAVGTVESIQPDDDTVLSPTTGCGAEPARGSRIDAALVAYLLDGTSLDDSPINITQVTLTDLGSHVREVEVGIMQLVKINVLTEIRVGGIRGTEVYGLCIGQCAVATLTCAGTCEDANLEGTAGCMLCLCLLCYLGRSTLRNTSRRKTT